MKVGLTAILIFLILGVSLPPSGFPLDEAGPVQKKYADIHLNPDGFTSSAECAKCHEDIHASWKNSLHAQSLDNPVFQTAYLQAHFERGDLVRETCLHCHAPLTRLNRDFLLDQPITREGISCDFCHSIAGVQAGLEDPRYQFEFGNLKQGPLKNLKSPIHKTRYNNLFKNSLLCKSCHEWENPKGLKLIETYSEWLQGPYPARGIHCQNCHMRKVSGKIVAPEVKETPETEISSHDIAGGHSLSLREKSIAIKIVEINRLKMRVDVIVEITNEAAGHKIPTGLPSKQIILQVSIISKSGEAVFSKEKIYQKVILDRDGAPLSRDVDFMLGKGVEISSDNRIGPLETRREKFTFFISPAEGQTVSAAVFYHHLPLVIQPAPILIKMHEVRANFR